MYPELKKIDDYRWEIPRTGEMRVPGLIYASESMLPKISEDKATTQVANVATLPGIVGHSLAMPDIHWGYGFPIGGVAAMDFKDGVISPGGIGFDISCGVRLLRSNLKKNEIDNKKASIVNSLFYNVPSGVGSTGRINLSSNEMKKVFEKGSRWSVERGYGEREDLETCEDGGCLDSAEPDLPSQRAIERGKDQLGTLGSGNHFLEIQFVEEIYDPEIASAFGLFKDQVTVMIHTGSRGCGYQICDDSLRVMRESIRKYGIRVPDPQLACAPLSSKEGKNYLGVMAAAANYARANRQAITHWVRESFMKTLSMGPKDLGMGVVYDVCHNVGKIEEHEVNGQLKKLCIHRKGATRAFPAGHPEVPEKYRSVGQPVLIPGTMGTYSYVAVGTEKAMKETFGTICHGAGRAMSRTQALKRVNGYELQRELEKSNILVKSASYRRLAEEAPFAYKDVNQVVDVCHRAGLSLKVARLKPLAVVKG